MSIIEKPDGHTYYAGSNMPGYMPDDPPTDYDSSADAMIDVRESARSDTMNAADVGDITCDECEAILMQIKSWRADSNGEFGCTLRGRHYFVQGG